MFLPHGARIYNTLMDFIKEEYWKRNYTEVCSPNIYNTKLWEISGHWKHYQDNMFSFQDSDDQTFALKPMSSPCAMPTSAPCTATRRAVPSRGSPACGASSRT